MPSPIFKAVKTERDSVAKEFSNAQSYLDKALAETQNCTINVGLLKAKLDIFDTWIAANPDV